ncbi:hypothetical protein [Methylobacterium sp. V23]|uniref:hypothetical protein n=1 Tax=Methylobacterium sp. V23 TaxID=2044878 RepID=UPI000CDB9FC2|nr:hypothetical protein [Methylobacterium sp. V23]POR39945.1 hypothetical protein CRT23_26595 [Methylobacterium sp. V23]
MSDPIRKTWDSREFGPAFGEVAHFALTQGQVVVHVPGLEDVVIVAKRKLDNMRPTPQQFVRENKVSDEAADLLDEMMGRGRSDTPAPFGI